MSCLIISEVTVVANKGRINVLPIPITQCFELFSILFSTFILICLCFCLLLITFLL